MNHSTPQVIIDLEEYESLKKQIEQLSAPGAEEELTMLEHQEATGKLLYVVLNNPGLFREANSAKQPLDLGKYIAIIYKASTSMPSTDRAERVLTTTPLVHFKRKK